MKARSLICVLAVVCMLALTACSGGNNETKAPETTPAATEAALYVPGEYTAEAQGMESKVKVTITVDANAITDVVIDASGETPSLGGVAAEKMQPAILEAQSAEVDAMTGATVTSNAIITALTDCLSQAAAQ